jgi:peptidylprolyl isomerase
MRKLDLRLLPLAALLALAGCFTPANYGEGIKDAKGHGPEAGPADQHGAEHGAEHAAEPAVVTGIVPGSAPRKLDMDTPRIEFEPPFDGEPTSSNKLASGVLVETFAAGEGAGVTEGQILEFNFKGYSASTSRQIMGSRVAPMRLLIDEKARERDGMTRALIDGVLGAKAGAKLRIKVPASIVDKDIPAGRPPLGDIWVVIDVVKVEDRIAPKTADAYAGEPIATAKRDNGLQTFDYVAGEGRESKLGDRVVVHYIGKLDDGTVFDQSHDRADGLNVVLGAGGVIAGMAEGLEGVKPGMLRKLVIPPELGYGAQPNGPIPANSTLTFLIEVVTVEDAPAPGPMPGPPPPAPGAPSEQPAKPAKPEGEKPAKPEGEKPAKPEEAKAP